MKNVAHQLFFFQVKSTQGRETAAENVEAILDHLYTHDRGICVNCPKVAAVRLRWVVVLR